MPQGKWKPTKHSWCSYLSFSFLCSMHVHTYVKHLLSSQFGSVIANKKQQWWKQSGYLAFRMVSCNTELWNCFRKVDSTLEAHSGNKCTILFYRITYIGSSWENFLKTTALHQLSSTMSFWRRSSWEVVPSQVHTCFPFNLMCLSESLLVFCGDIATETFVFGD